MYLYSVSTSSTSSLSTPGLWSGLTKWHLTWSEVRVFISLGFQAWIKMRPGILEMQRLWRIVISYNDQFTSCEDTKPQDNLVPVDHKLWPPLHQHHPLIKQYLMKNYELMNMNLETGGRGWWSHGVVCSISSWCWRSLDADTHIDEENEWTMMTR